MISTTRLGATLRQTREALGLSLRDLERQTGGSLRSGYLSQLERGLIRRPTPQTLSKLADLLGLDYRDLLTQAGHRVPSDRGSSTYPTLVAGMPIRALEELDEADQAELRQFVAFLKQRRRPESERSGSGGDE